MKKSRFHAAFSATAGALLFTLAGLSGYAINWHGAGPFGRWSGAPVLWEVGLGAAFAFVALVAWRRAIRTP
jgi:hypothetical protein